MYKLAQFGFNVSCDMLICNAMLGIDKQWRNRSNIVTLVSICLPISWWRHQRETFPRYWPFVRGIHRWLVNSPHKGQWRGALIFSLIWGWINGWLNNRKAGDLRRHRAHYGVTVIYTGATKQEHWFLFKIQALLYDRTCQMRWYRHAEGLRNVSKFAIYTITGKWWSDPVKWCLHKPWSKMNCINLHKHMLCCHFESKP